MSDNMVCPKTNSAKYDIMTESELIKIHMGPYFRLSLLQSSIT